MTKPVSTAWLVAARELGIRVEAPYLLIDPSGHDQVECLAFINDLGSPAGTVVVEAGSSAEPARSISSRLQMCLSQINEDSYATYDRDLFVDTLNDWGWHGCFERVPSWYTGAPWT